MKINPISDPQTLCTFKAAAAAVARASMNTFSMRSLMQAVCDWQLYEELFN